MQHKEPRKEDHGQEPGASGCYGKTPERSDLPPRPAEFLEVKGFSGAVHMSRGLSGRGSNLGKGLGAAGDLQMSGLRKRRSQRWSLERGNKGDNTLLAPPPPQLASPPQDTCDNSD